MRVSRGTHDLCDFAHLVWDIYTKTLTNIVSQEDEYTATARMICVILHICWVIYTKTLTNIVSQEDEYTTTKNLSFLSILRKDS